MGAQAVRLSNVDINKALENKDFEVLFQPIFVLGDGTLSRLESFVRWRHPSLGILPPGAFISFFESQGRMGELTRYVVDEAVRRYVEWRGPYAPGISVNLALTDLSDEAFAPHLAKLLRDYDFPPELITLECPMPPVNADADVIASQFQRLRKSGTRLAIEVRGRANDFLRNIDPFPFDEIKTGGSSILRFARTVRGPGLSAISDLLDLSKSSNATITAVGVEDQASLSALRGLGFTAAQGNHMGKVGDIKDFTPTKVNTVRGQLGLEALSETDLNALFRSTPPAEVSPVEVVSEPETISRSDALSEVSSTEQASDDSIDPMARERARQKLKMKALAKRAKAREERKAAAIKRAKEKATQPDADGITPAGNADIIDIDVEAAPYSEAKTGQIDGADGENEDFTAPTDPRILRDRIEQEFTRGKEMTDTSHDEEETPTNVDDGPLTVLNEDDTEAEIPDAESLSTAVSDGQADFPSSDTASEVDEADSILSELMDDGFDFDDEPAADTDPLENKSTIERHAELEEPKEAAGGEKPNAPEKFRLPTEKAQAYFQAVIKVAGAPRTAELYRNVQLEEAPQPRSVTQGSLLTQSAVDTPVTQDFDALAGLTPATQTDFDDLEDEIGVAEELTSLSDPAMSDPSPASGEDILSALDDHSDEDELYADLDEESGELDRAPAFRFDDDEETVLGSLEDDGESVSVVLEDDIVADDYIHDHTDAETYRDPKENLLTRKYKIVPTHFWPKKWKRAVKRWRADHFGASSENV